MFLRHTFAESVLVGSLFGERDPVVGSGVSSSYIHCAPSLRPVMDSFIDYSCWWCVGFRVPVCKQKRRATNLARVGLGPRTSHRPRTSGSQLACQSGHGYSGYIDLHLTAEQNYSLKQERKPHRSRPGLQPHCVATNRVQVEQVEHQDLQATTREFARYSGSSG